MQLQSKGFDLNPVDMNILILKNNISSSHHLVGIKSAFLWHSLSNNKANMENVNTRKYEECIITQPKQWTEVTLGPQGSLHFKRNIAKLDIFLILQALLAWDNSLLQKKSDYIPLMTSYLQQFRFSITGAINDINNKNKMSEVCAEELTRLEVSNVLLRSKELVRWGFSDTHTQSSSVIVIFKSEDFFPICLFFSSEYYAFRI